MLTTLFSCVKDSECIDSNLINKDAVIIAVYEPVCGCDNITYSNSSEAESHGVILVY